MVAKKALIIEDDMSSAKVLAHLLSREGVESIIVTNLTLLGEQAHTNPDLVFVDLEMPQKNGYEVLTELLNYPHYNEVPIVASSVYIGEINNVRNAGFDGFIGKPLAKEKFPDQLQRILDGESIWEIS